LTQNDGVRWMEFVELGGESGAYGQSPVGTKVPLHIDPLTARVLSGTDGDQPIAGARRRPFMVEQLQLRLRELIRD